MIQKKGRHFRGTCVESLPLHKDNVDGGTRRKSKYSQNNSGRCVFVVDIFSKDNTLYALSTLDPKRILHLP